MWSEKKNPHHFEPRLANNATDQLKEEEGFVCTCMRGCVYLHTWADLKMSI